MKYILADAKLDRIGAYWNKGKICVNYQNKIKYNLRTNEGFIKKTESVTYLCKIFALFVKIAML